MGVHSFFDFFFSDIAHYRVLSKIPVTRCLISQLLENENENYNDVSPLAGQNSPHQNNLQTINTEEGREKGEPSRLFVEM